MLDRDMVRRLIVEFLGPFTLVFAGVGSIILTQGQDIVAIAFAHGLAIGLMVLAAGHISGGHFNPAVTVAMFVTRRIDQRTAVLYILAQLGGGVAAAGALTLVYRDLERNAVNLGLPAVGTNLSASNALVAEMIMTFFLVFVIFGTAVDERTPKIISGLAIGLTITMDILAGGAISGAAVNPARWFGPAIVQGDFADFWIWIVGPVVGGVVAAVLYNDVLLDRGGGPASWSRRPSVDDELEPDDMETVAPAPRSRRAQRRRR
jgi:MIP family channel proteins